MLKLNYTDVGLHVEQMQAPLETLIAQRVTLAMRLGHTLQVEVGLASMLLTAAHPDLPLLEAALRRETGGAGAIAPVDADCVEVSLCGTWLSDSPLAAEGTFFVALGDRTEHLLYHLWHSSQISMLPKIR
ncbi:MAG: hypothetical protein KME20_22870 [Kaiparowitsia implicata GSE-PSE-MK54-09C]|nr:hypothetical protein [Kaiparowitsia implicata GSE-PSE-MK54-09C]